MRGNGRKVRVVIIATVFVVIAMLTCFALMYLRQVGPFRKPGELIFVDSMTDEDRDFVNRQLPADFKLETDVTVSAESSLLAPTGDNVVIYDVLLPVTDFYDSRMSISRDELSQINTPEDSPDSANTDIDEGNVINNGLDDVELISLSDLDFTKKLLAINEEYFLDTLNSGAIFKYYVVSSGVANTTQTRADEVATNDVHRVVELISSQALKLPEKSEILAFAQTGVTALSRGMTRRLNQINDAKAFASGVAEILSNFDLTHTSNEASFSSQASTGNICADERMIDVLTAIGLDIVELTGNHNQDCGDEDAIKTIDKYNELGIKTVGGGKTATEAAAPLEIEQKNTGITMLAYNYSTGGYTTDDTPGANYYTEEKAKADIEAAKARGDFVIVDVQFYECSGYASGYEDTTCDAADSSAGDQIGFFRHLIDLGADVVVGTSAHQPQTFELYGNGAIYYGLGNLFFDQSKWPGTTRSLVLVHYFYDGKLLQTRLMPTVYDNNYQTRFMDEPEATTFVGRLVEAKP